MKKKTKRDLHFQLFLIWMLKNPVFHVDLKSIINSFQFFSGS